MDRSMFLLFVGSKQLYPKAHEELQEANKVKGAEDDK
jgi:hypothetical protein